MSVTIIDSPKLFDFAGNGLKYKIKGDGYITVPGAKAHFVFRKVGTLQDSDKFHFPIPDNYTSNITVTAESGPGYNHIAANVSIEQTASNLNGIPDLIKYYKFWVENTDELHCEFLNVGFADTAYLAFDGSAYEDIWDDPSLYILQGVTRVVRDNYSLKGFLYFQDKFITTLTADADSDGYADFDFGKFISKNIFEIGEIIHDIYKNTTDISFKAGFAESYDEGTMPILFDAEKQVMPGKIKFEEYKMWTDTSMFYNILKKQDTHSNAFLKICLAYGNNDDHAKPIFVKFYYTDKTSEQITIYPSLTDHMYDIIFLDLKVEELLAQANTTKQVYRFDIASSTTSEVIKYYLQNFTYLTKEFAFRNSFGVFETFLAIGEKTTSKTIARNLYKRYVPADYETIDGEYTSVVTNSYNEYSVQTGSKTLNEINQIADALKSEFFYERKNDTWIKCELLNDSTQISNEEDFLHSLNIKYRYSSDD